MLKDYLPYYKRNLRLAFPIMLTQFGGSLVGLADSIMVGHYSTTDLAGVSLGNGIFFTFMVFAMGAVMGLTPLVGQSYVKQQTERIASLFLNGLIYTFVLTIATCILLCACVPLMIYMRQDATVVSAARPYLIMRIAGIIPFMLFCSCKQFLEGVGNTMVAMVTTLSANVVNIILNYIFIFGKCGLSPMGAFGAGLSSMIASVLYLIGIVFAILHNSEWRQYIRLFSRQMVSRAMISELNRVGLPIGMQTTMETVLFTLSFILVGWISKEALAAHQIANQIAELTFMLALGIGAATTIRVSHQYGLQDYKAMRMAANASIHLVLIMNTIGAALMIGLRHHIPMLFTSDKAVIDIASQLLVFAGLFQYSDGLQCVGAGMLRGLTDVKAAMIYAVISYVIIALPLGYVLMFVAGMGVNGMWLSFIVALALAAICFHMRFRRLYRNLIN